MLITEQYRQQQAELHAVGNYGTASLHYGETVADLVTKIGATSLLDYGCGSKRSLLKVLRLPQSVVYEGYDPAIPEYADDPMPAELVCCIDVLEHIEPGLLDNVLAHLASLCDPYGFFTIHSGPAGKVLSDGRNAHLTQQPFEWWLPKLSRHFEVITHSSIPSGFALLVRSLQSGNLKPRPSSLYLPAPRALPRKTEQAAAAVPSAPAVAEAPKPQLVLKIDGHRLTFPALDGDPGQWNRVFGLDERVLDWLRGLKPGAYVIDLGSAYGARAVYAATVKQARVHGLESSESRREWIRSAVESNQVAERVTLVSALEVDSIVREAPRCNHVMLDVLALEMNDVAAVKDVVRAASRDTRLLLRVDPSVDWHRELLQWMESQGLRDADTRPANTSPTAWRSLARSRLVRGVSVVLPLAARARGVLNHVCRRVETANVIESPFPYAVIDNILPGDYYAEAVANFPGPAQMKPISETGRVGKDGYPERYVTLFTPEEFARLTDAQLHFWTEFADWMYSDMFLHAFLSKFQIHLEPRLRNILAAGGGLMTRGDALLVNDHTQFKIGPHTDAPHRLVTFLFYMPKDESMKRLGTSIYRPKDPEFVCWGGPHHPSDNFELVDTVDFIPNRLLAFPKTERSFHGVEQISGEGIVRPLLINNIRLLNKVTH